MANAQRYVTINPGVDDNIYITIQADSAARIQALPIQTIYLLKRDALYSAVTTINNTNYYLIIKAEDGGGLLPYVYPLADAAGNYHHFLETSTGATLENIEFDMLTPTGSYGNRSLGANTRATLRIKSCIIEHDRGAATTCWGDSTSIFLEDCFIHSVGHPKTIGGNGRVFDVRATNHTDTLSAVNCTFFDLTQAIVRVGGGDFDYIKFDHCTSLQLERGGSINAAITKHLVVTNNLWIDQDCLGGRLFTYTIGSVCSDAIVRMDTVLDGTIVTIRNNDIYWDPAYKTIWENHGLEPFTYLPFPDSASYKAWAAQSDPDSVMMPTTIRKETWDAMGADTVNAYFSERLNFKSPPPTLLDFTTALLNDWNATELPDNWYWGTKDSIDLSYGTTARSYTAGDYGLPLGDLNWFPDKKTVWLTGVNDKKNDNLLTKFSLEQNYPNPFNPSTVIKYNLAKSHFVTLKIFNLLGQEVASLVNQQQTVGEHTVNFKANNLSSGIYFYQLKSGSFSQTKKMMLLK